MFSDGYDPLTTDKLFATGPLQGITPHHVGKGTTFIHNDFPADTVHFLLHGTVRVVVGTPDGREIAIDVQEAPDLFGVIEAVQGQPVYTGSVVTVTDCLFARQSAERFLESVYSHVGASGIMVRYLVWLAARNMRQAELKAIATPKDNLAFYLYTRAAGRPLPCMLGDTRKAISEQVHINLRTLYRYLAQFEEEGAIHLKHGKIVVDEAGLKKLETQLMTQYRDILV